MTFSKPFDDCGGESVWGLKRPKMPKVAELEVAAVGEFSADHFGERSGANFLWGAPCDRGGTLDLVQVLPCSVGNAVAIDLGFGSWSAGEAHLIRGVRRGSIVDEPAFDIAI